ncbi:hypothetical protein A3835_04585 [Campylobacter concisus]|jgi:hypothetical protein|uniref:Uncharacterized protein n=1 Tax=Campylobacter concisus TaxID=199 RepID=A0A1X0U1T5_9BACT|nr:hypothetical protein [Campylobacter concisus]ORI07779.1 hypothetical protein A3835_04585 [Campylobacter concisus]
MTNAEIAKKLKIAEKTIYNWRKNRKELFEVIENGLNSKKNKESLYVNDTYKELIQLFEKLSEQEIQYYILDIKTRILKKEIDK